MIPEVFLPQGSAFLDGGMGQDLYFQLGDCCEIGRRHIAHLRQELDEERFHISSGFI